MTRPLTTPHSRTSLLSGPLRCFELVPRLVWLQLLVFFPVMLQLQATACAISTSQLVPHVLLAEKCRFVELHTR